MTSSFFPGPQGNLASVSIPTPHDVSLSRSVDTVYQNLTGKTITIISDVVLVAHNTGGGTVSAVAGMCMGLNPDPINNGDFYPASSGVESDALPATQTTKTQNTLIMVVPPDYYYALYTISKTGDGSLITINDWIEYY